MCLDVSSALSPSAVEMTRPVPISKAEGSAQPRGRREQVGIQVAYWIRVDAGA